MQIGIIGINHTTDLNLRDTFAKVCQMIFSAERSLHPQHPYVLLSTCNRTEIYFSSSDLSETHSYFLDVLRNEIGVDFDKKLYSFFGPHCFSHLIRVTSGLDSLIPAETEIQGQVKFAYETTMRYQRLPKDLHLLFQKSLGAAKKIRTAINFEKDIPHLENAILSIGKNYFTTDKLVSVLFVGVSAINLKVMKYLSSKQYSEITICNRTRSSAEQLAGDNGMQLLEWESLKSSWHKYDWLILGTKSPVYLIEKVDCTPTIMSKMSRKLIMDLSVPRNVDPLLKIYSENHSEWSLFNIDELNRSVKIRRQALHAGLKKAEDMVQYYVEQYFLKQQNSHMLEMNIHSA